MDIRVTFTSFSKIVVRNELAVFLKLFNYLSAVGCLKVWNLPYLLLKHFTSIVTNIILYILYSSSSKFKQVKLHKLANTSSRRYWTCWGYRNWNVYRNKYQSVGLSISQHSRPHSRMFLGTVVQLGLPEHYRSCHQLGRLFSVVSWVHLLSATGRLP